MVGEQKLFLNDFQKVNKKKVFERKLFLNDLKGEQKKSVNGNYF